MDSPPDIPAFTANAKKLQKESVAEAIAGAAVTFVKTLNTPQPSKVVSEVCETVTKGISSGKTIELQMKNLGQLRYL